MVLSLVFAVFDGQLLRPGFLPDQRWSGVKHAENSKDLGTQAVSCGTAKGLALDGFAKVPGTGSGFEDRGQKATAVQFTAASLDCFFKTSQAE